CGRAGDAKSPVSRRPRSELPPCIGGQSPPFPHGQVWVPIVGQPGPGLGSDAVNTARVVIAHVKPLSRATLPAVPSAPATVKESLTRNPPRLGGSAKKSHA